MTLLMQCPICSQNLVFRGQSHTARAICPACKGPITVRNPQLSEQEILGILGRPAVRP